VKKLTFLVLICVLLVGAIYGQGIRDEQGANTPQQNNERQRRNERPQNSEAPRRNERPQSNETPRRNEPQRVNETVTVEGTLKLERGFVAVESGEAVYLVPMLNRYIGFINDLKEGARVSVEGREFRNVIQPTKVTIGGRDYDFPAFNRSPAFGAQQNNQGNRRVDPRQDNFQPRRNNSAPNRRPAEESCCR